MNEPVKTMLLAALAVALVVGAVVISVDRREQKAQDRVGEMLVDIEDPLSVKAIKMVTFDSKEGKPQRFEVKQTEQGFVIPTSENYPADGKVPPEKQGEKEESYLAKAANSLNKLKIISVAGEGIQAHEDFGVVDPESPDLKTGAKHVGTKVLLEDSAGNSLADLIIGNEVEDSRGQRYVRLAKNDQVYTLGLSTKYLSTRMENWIEKDLLQMDPLDLKQVVLSDYAVKTTKELAQTPDGAAQEVTVVTGVTNRSRFELNYDGKELKWDLGKWLTYQDGRGKQEKLAPDQELDQQKLDDMKGALDDLKIAGVQKKPVALEGDLQKFIGKDPAAYASLYDRGFYPMPVDNLPDGRPVFDLLSDQGEVTVCMNNGVEYKLRFGAKAGEQAKEDKKPAAGAKPPVPDTASDELKALRYLFVVARFNADLIPKPELEKLPPDEAKDVKKDEVKKDDAKSDAAKKDAPKKEEPKAPAAKKDEPKKAEPKKDAQKKEEPKKDEAKGATAKKDEPKPDADKKAETTPDPEALKKQREAIELRNAQRQTKYAEDVAAGRKQVEELNKRFGAWYYIISDETYQKIHLGQKDVIQKKTAKDARPPGAQGMPGFQPGFNPHNIVPQGR